MSGSSVILGLCRFSNDKKRNSRAKRSYTLSHFGESFGMDWTLFFLKFYGQVISGVWATVILFPLEGMFHGNGFCVRNICYGVSYLWFLLSVTILFLLSSVFLPRIRFLYFRRNLRSYLSGFTMTPKQRQDLIQTVGDSNLFESPFNKHGVWQFVSMNAMNLGAISIFFSVEEVIAGFGGTVIKWKMVAMFFVLGVFFATLVKIANICHMFVSYNESNSDGEKLSGKHVAQEKLVTSLSCILNSNYQGKTVLDPREVAIAVNGMVLLMENCLSGYGCSIGSLFVKHRISN